MRECLHMKWSKNKQSNTHSQASDDSPVNSSTIDCKSSFSTLVIKEIFKDDEKQNIIEFDWKSDVDDIATGVSVSMVSHNINGRQKPKTRPTVQLCW